MELYLSIIVPVYNTEKYLKKCIDSILAQTYRNYELILVDDGSSDDSPAICDEYAKRDERIRVIRKQHKGVMNARKVGVLNSCGKYISFVDSDDWIEKDFYDAFINKLQKNSVDVLMTGYQEEEVKSRNRRTGLVNGVYHKKEIKQILESRMIIPSLCLKLFKRELIKKNIFLIDDHVYIGEDLLCTYACLLDADTIMVQNTYRYHYVQRESSAMHLYSEKKIKNLYYFAQNIKDIRCLKKVDFLDLVWNRFIVNELLYVIEHEFGKQDLSISKTELVQLKRKFARLDLYHLLVQHDYTVIKTMKNNRDRIILILYFLKVFRLLNLYIVLTRKQDI